MKKWKRWGLGLITSIAGLLLLSSCGKKKATSGQDDKIPTLQIYQVGDKPKNYQKLISKANKIFEDKINAHVKFNYIGWGDFTQKMSVMVSSGDDYDIARADNYVVNAQKGAYADLTKLLPKYAKKAYDDLDPAYIKGNLVNGKLYAMPVQGNVFASANLAFNKKYLKKYDLDISQINTLQDVEPLLKKVHENEKDVTTFAAGKGFKVAADFDYVTGNGLPFAVNLKGDSTKIVNPYDSEQVQKNLETMHEYYKKGYIAQDAASATRDYPLDSDTWFVRQETVGPYDYGNNILNTSAGGDRIEVRPITDNYKTSMQAQVSNWVVSNSSKHKKLAAKALGVLNGNPELLNGLVWGVEGEAWKKLPDNKVELLDGFDPNKRMPAWNTGNNHILYTTTDITDEMIAKRDQSIKEAKESPTLGFNFDQSKVKTQISSLQNVMDKYADGINTGTLEPKAAIKKMNKELKTAGYDTVQKEAQKQYDHWRKQK